MQYKRFLGVLPLLILAACTPTVTPPPVEKSASSSSVAAMVEKPTMRIVDVTVTDWSITPTIVTAAKGEKVQLRLKGGTGIHGLLVADLGLNVRIESGEERIVDLPTDTVGTFAGKCNVPCGPGHRDMTFSVVVQ